jgi:hypothetical protein
MVTEAVYNELMSNLFKMANDGPMSILGHLRKHPGKKMQLVGGVKLKSKYTFRRRILPIRVVHRRTTQQRVRDRTMDTICLLTSAIYIIYIAYNHMAQTTGPNMLSLDTLLLNILGPVVGDTILIMVISQILFFLVNFQVPILLTQSLVNVSNSWARHGNTDGGLIAAQEISDDLFTLSGIAETGTVAADPIGHRWDTTHTIHPRPMSRGISAENIAVTLRQLAPTNMMKKRIDERNQSFPTYAEFADSTRDYLLKRSLELTGANKRRVMLLAMSTMTRKVVVLLLTTRPGQRNVRDISNMFSRMKIKTVSKALPAPSLAEYTQCDNCGNTDEENVVTFSRKCGNCPYDMCDTCYSTLQRSFGYNSANLKKCPGCKADL